MDQKYQLQLADSSTGFERSFAAGSDSWTVRFDATTPVTVSGWPSIASCYGSLSLGTSLWWLLMWCSNELVPNKGKTHALFISGLALAKLSDGKFHRVGYVKCWPEEHTPVLEDRNKLPSTGSHSYEELGD
jgi:hypothetical protein